MSTQEESKVPKQEKPVYAIDASVLVPHPSEQATLIDYGEVVMK